MQCCLFFVPFNCRYLTAHFEFHLEYIIIIYNSILVARWLDLHLFCKLKTLHTCIHFFNFPGNYLRHAVKAKLFCWQKVWFFFFYFSSIFFCGFVPSCQSLLLSYVTVQRTMYSVHLPYTIVCLLTLWQSFLIFLRELSPWTLIIQEIHCLFWDWWKCCFGHQKKVGYCNNNKSFLGSFLEMDKTSP